MRSRRLTGGGRGCLQGGDGPGPPGPGKAFADTTAWQGRLRALGITQERHVRIATEGALLGSLIAHGVSPELAILSDGAGPYDVLVHAACGIHAERPLARLIPYSEEHRAAIEQVRQQIWELYQDLKAYRQQPEPSRRGDLGARFDALCAQRTGSSSARRRHTQGDAGAPGRRVVAGAGPARGPVAHQPERRRHLRDYVTKRKISGGTRSELGRRARDTFASLKKTCRELGVNFWAYLQDRVRGAGRVPRLAELIRRKAEETTARKAGAAQPAYGVGGGRGGVNAKARVPQDFRAISARRGCPRLLRSYRNPGLTTRVTRLASKNGLELRPRGRTSPRSRRACGHGSRRRRRRTWSRAGPGRGRRDPPRPPGPGTCGARRGCRGGASRSGT